MNSAIPDRSEGQSQFQDSAPGQPPDAPDTTPGRQLLDQVVRRTLSVLDCEAASPQNREAMSDVARRRGGELVTDPTVARDLIDAVLQTSWPAWSSWEIDRRELLDEIVDVVLTDPVARARLEGLWRLLVEGGP